MEHGTVEMYRKELRDEGLEPCEACKAAHAVAISEYRKTQPPRDRSAETRATTIRQRALTRLAGEYPERLTALLAEEQSNNA